MSLNLNQIKKNNVQMSAGIKFGLCQRIGCFESATHEVIDRLQPAYGKRRACEEHAQKPKAWQLIKHLKGSFIRATDSWKWELSKESLGGFLSKFEEKD